MERDNGITNLEARKQISEICLVSRRKKEQMLLYTQWLWGKGENQPDLY